MAAVTICSDFGARGNRPTIGWVTGQGKHGDPEQQGGVGGAVPRWTREHAAEMGLHQLSSRLTLEYTEGDKGIPNHPA